MEEDETAATDNGTIEFEECRQDEDGTLSVGVAVRRGNATESWRITGDFTGQCGGLKPEDVCQALISWAVNNVIDPHIQNGTSPANYTYAMSRADVEAACRDARSRLK